MKVIALWASTLAFAMLAIACHRHRNHISMSDDHNKVEMIYDGDFNFNDDETEIAHMSPRAYLRYRNNDDRLEAGNNSNGVVQYEISINGRIVDPKSAEGKAFLVKAIRSMIGLGFDLDGRIDRVYRRGGNAALLSASDSISGDYARGRYLERVLETDSLSPVMIAGIIRRIGSGVEGDYDKQRLLSRIDTGYLGIDSVAMDYLAAARTIDGDYERGIVLKNYLRGGLKEGPLFDSLLVAVNQTDGDFEKGNLLKEIVHKDIRRSPSWAGLIRSTAAMDGDYEKSNLLIEIGERLPKTDSLRTVFMAAAKTVHSDNDYGRVVRAVEHDAPAERSREGSGEEEK